MSIAGKLTTIAENVQKVYESGKQEEQQTFWEVYQRGGRRNQYRNAFYDACWTDENYNPKYPIICSTISSSAFEYCGITDTKVDINFSHTSSTNVFRNCAALKIIRKLIVTENVGFTNWFIGCSALLEINFDGVIGQNLDLSDSSKFNLTGVSSISSHLKSLEDGETKTVSFHQDVINELNTYGNNLIAEMTQKGWSVV